MIGLREIVLGLAVLEAGWLTFDGGRALIVGDYVTPRAGGHAGQLGPWADLVSALGIDPRSTFMKSVHLGLGLGWLAVAAAFFARVPRSWTGMLICAVLGLWYLPFGTILSVVQVMLLMLPAVRDSGP